MFVRLIEPKAIDILTRQNLSCLVRTSQIFQIKSNYVSLDVIQLYNASFDGSFNLL